MSAHDEINLEKAVLLAFFVVLSTIAFYLVQGSDPGMFRTPLFLPFVLFLVFQATSPEVGSTFVSHMARFLNIYRLF